MNAPDTLKSELFITAVNNLILFNKKKKFYITNKRYTRSFSTAAGDAQLIVSLIVVNLITEFTLF